MMNAGPYSIGSAHFPGTSKLIEEAGEVLQVLGKLMAVGGDLSKPHWDGQRLDESLINEFGDLKAAIDFFMRHNMSIDERCLVEARRSTKLGLFTRWHKAQRTPKTEENR